MNIVLYITNKWYRRYWNHKSGRSPIAVPRGAGYYSLHLDGSTKELQMQSGLTAIIQYISHTNFRDPGDMIESSIWKLVGYKGLKPISDCSWNEFKEQYLTLPVWKER